MSDQIQYAYTGPGFAGWLTLLFIGLKLTGYIDWSWVWVLAPLWITFILYIAFILLWVFVVMRNY